MLAAWSVLGVYLSLFPTFAGQSTGVHSLAFGGSLRHLGSVVRAAQRGQVMSAFYVLAHSAMSVATILAGWAATSGGLAAIFPWFSLAVALACVGAGTMGLLGSRPARIGLAA